MPGLLRGVARTAVVAGTATAVSNRVSRRQAERWARKEDEQGYPADDQDVPQQVAPPPAPAAPAPPVQEAPVAAASSMDVTIEQLKKLGELRDTGVLTDAEFEAQKAKLLGG